MINQKDVNKKIVAMTRVALDINVMGKAHVFVYVSPHCNSITIRVYLNGWREGTDPDYEADFHTVADPDFWDPWNEELYRSVMCYLKDLRRKVREEVEHGTDTKL